MIQLENICVNFTDKHHNLIKAVDDASFSVTRGEVFGIIGYSGAGKSSLIRVINLLQKPVSGKIIVNGQSMIELTPQQLRLKRKKIGMIFQNFNLMNSSTVYENILYPLRHSALSHQDKDKKINRLLKLVGLESKRDVYPSQLSGGQKQRVAIARALANDPEILLCDEATSALDPKTTLSILKLLKDLNKVLGLTIVLITHEMQVVKEICHRVAVMEQGRIVELNDIVNIFGYPQQQVTKDFIRTASHIEQAYEKIFQHPALSKLLQYDKLFEIRYAGYDMFQPFLTQLFDLYAVGSTILYSNLEIINQQIVGYLIVFFSGDDVPIDKISSFFHDRNISLSNLSAIQHENNYLI